MSGYVDFIIMMMVGVFVTLQGYEVICIGKPGAGDFNRLAKWQKAQAFYRLGGPLLIVIGIFLLLFSR